MPRLLHDPGPGQRSLTGCEGKNAVQTALLCCTGISMSACGNLSSSEVGSGASCHAPGAARGGVRAAGLVFLPNAHEGPALFADAAPLNRFFVLRTRSAKTKRNAGTLCRTPPLVRRSGIRRRPGTSSVRKSRSDDRCQERQRNLSSEIASPDASTLISFAMKR